MLQLLHVMLTVTILQIHVQGLQVAVKCSPVHPCLGFSLQSKCTRYASSPVPSAAGRLHVMIEYNIKLELLRIITKLILFLLSLSVYSL